MCWIFFPCFKLHDTMLKLTLFQFSKCHIAIHNFYPTDLLVKISSFFFSLTLASCPSCQRMLVSMTWNGAKCTTEKKGITGFYKLRKKSTLAHFFAERNSWAHIWTTYFRSLRIVEQIIKNGNEKLARHCILTLNQRAVDTHG